jgi:hypothetical protein
MDIQTINLNGYEIESITSQGYARITRDGDFIMDISYTNVPTDTVLKCLNILGITATMKPTITLNDYNWLIAMDINEKAELWKSEGDGVLKCNGFHYNGTWHLFKFMKPNTHYSVSQLLKMKIQD